MKQWVIRFLCAILLLAMAIGLMVGVILAVPEEEAPRSWSKVTFITGGQQELRIYDATGGLVASLQTDTSGQCTTELLAERSYYGACENGLIQFELTSLGLGSISGGAAREDAFTLSFSGNAKQGSLTISGTARQEWYEYVLQSEDYSRREILQCVMGERLQCTMEALPYGSYTLLENGRVLCRVELTVEKPHTELALP
ncbi:MAG: hypothetical protein IKM59_06425 [Oscillospiraceae bacterium]|nr:hypothetical protein [Oscillospiraceae bacterium]